MEDRKIELVLLAAKIDGLGDELDLFKSLQDKLTDEEVAVELFLRQLTAGKIVAPVINLALELLNTIEDLTPDEALNLAITKGAKKGASTDVMSPGQDAKEALPRIKKDRRGRPKKHTDAINKYLAKIDTNVLDADALKAAANAAGRPKKAIDERKKKGLKIAEIGDTRFEKDCFRIDTPLGDTIPYAKVAIFLPPAMPPSQDNKSENQVFTVVYATVFQHDKNDPTNTGTVEEEFSTLSEAIDAYKLIKEKEREAPIIAHTRTVRSYLPVATEMLSKLPLTPSDLRRIPRNIGFALACYFVKSDSAQKRSEEGRDALLRNLDLIRRLLDDMEWPTVTEEITRDPRSKEDQVEDWIPELVINQKFKEGYLTQTQFLLRVRIICDTFDLMHKYFGSHFPNVIFELSDAWLTMAKSFIANNLEFFNKEDNFPSLTLPDVKKILDYSAVISRVVYHQNILKLSTCLRMNEFHKLRREHLKGKKLEYNQIVEGATEPLITKTRKTRKKGYPPAPTSIVTRVIMKHLAFRMDDLPEIQRSDVNKMWKKGGDLRSLLIEEDGHERSLRTTGATLLRYGLTTKICEPIDPKIIMYRMSHINENMISMVYATNLPKDHVDRPDTYFNMKPIHLTRPDGSIIDVSVGEYLFDAWLLLDLLTRYRDLGEVEKIKEYILQEVDGTVEVKKDPAVF